eukprot:scaffold7626_cov159-Amphora_coffeaeformis.AAC.1
MNQQYTKFNSKGRPTNRERRSGATRNACRTRATARGATMTIEQRVPKCITVMNQQYTEFYSKGRPNNRERRSGATRNACRTRATPCGATMTIEQSVSSGLYHKVWQKIL